MRFIKKLFLVAVLLAAIFAGLSQFALAANLSQGFRSRESLPIGSLVTFSGSEDLVELATLSRQDHLLGVVTTPSVNLVNIDLQGSTAQVVVEGLAQVLAADINGEIKKGDRIALSPIDGVGMKATGPSKVIGVAQADFSSGIGNYQRQLRNKSGQSQTVVITSLPVLVSVEQYEPSGAASASVVVGGIQSAVSGLAGRDISTLRAVAAFLVVILAIVLAIVILYAAVTNGIKSIGRNPLAKQPVLRGLFQVVVAVSVIMIATVGAVYVIVGL